MMKFLKIATGIGMVFILCGAGKANSWEKPFVADEDTVGLWHFDGAAGSKVADSSRNENHGKLFGLERRMLATCAEGKFSTGVACCESGWVDIPEKSCYVGMDKLTVEAWVFLREPEIGGSGRSKLGEIVTTSGCTLRLTEDANGIEFMVHTEKGIVAVTSRTMEYEEWHHVAGTYDGKECHIFIDGKLSDRAKSGEGGGRVIAARTGREPDRQFDSPTVLRLYSPVTIGGGVNGIRAVIDEVRISKCVRY